MTWNKRKLLRIINWVIIVYCSIGIAFYYLQDKILLREKVCIQQKPSGMHSTQFSIPFNQFDTVLVSICHSSRDSISKKLVFYFGPIGHHTADDSVLVERLVSLGYDVAIADYPGFDKSSGDFDEHRMYEYAFQIRRVLQKKYQQASVILFGYQTGAAFAANLAISANTGSLVLLHPIGSAPNMLKKYAPIYPWSRMSKYELNTIQYIREVKIPTTVLANDEMPELQTALKKSHRYLNAENDCNHAENCEFSNEKLQWALQ